MKKKFLTILLILSIVFIFAGCNNEKSQEQTAIEIVTQTVSGPENGFWHTVFTVKNNTEEPINTVSLVINELDTSGNIIGTIYPQDPSLVQPGQTISLKGFHKNTNGIASVRATEVIYTAGENKLTDKTIKSNLKQEYLKNTEPLPLQ